MFTVHTKNKAPETGFNAEPASSHKSEEAALAAAKELAASADTYGNTVLIGEEGTNRSWTVHLISGEATVGYDEGVPFLVPAADQHFQVVYDARENTVTERREEGDNGSVSIFLDQSELPEGDYNVYVEEIAS